MEKGLWFSDTDMRYSLATFMCSMCGSGEIVYIVCKSRNYSLKS